MIAVGSPTHPILRTGVWAWFKFPQPVSKDVLSLSIRNPRRNPIALTQDWQRGLESEKAASRAACASIGYDEGSCHPCPKSSRPCARNEGSDIEHRRPYQGKGVRHSHVAVSVGPSNGELVPFPDGLVDTGKSPPTPDSRASGNDGQVKRVFGIRHIQMETVLVLQRRVIW